MEKLKVGDKAPFFKGVTTSGKEVSSDDYNSCKLVLYFYPKDNTSGCTAEACSLRDGYAELKAAGFEVLGVSPDSGQIARGGLQPNTRCRSSFCPMPTMPWLKRTVAGGLRSSWGASIWGMIRTTFVIKRRRDRAHLRQG